MNPNFAANSSIPSFLKTIETWRADLARNLALRNPELTQRELNFAVLRIIDRILFLRLCEGRGIEDDGRLQGLTNGDRIYPRLCQICERAADRYHSGLFHFKQETGRHEPPDELTLDLDLDDKLLRNILKSLYYPESLFVFSALPADILGQVHEQFLGKVIRLTQRHRAVVEEKPEVRKAGGVYYTPTCIVDYIVQKTVGKLLEEAMGSAIVPVAASGVPPEAAQAVAQPDAKGSRRDAARSARDARAPLEARSASRILNRASKLRILDPACGSGSFLLGAYGSLLQWHLDFYVRLLGETSTPHPASDAALSSVSRRQGEGSGVRWLLRRRDPPVVQTGSGWRLTFAERKRILLDNIYGVDIDAQAVETTKLSLLLKMLEGETQQSLQPVLRMFQERALPDLGANIRCGNSLIGPDLYRHSERSLLSDEERCRINVFDWQAAFPEIFKAGGFDAVIGNPPWGQKEVLATDGEKEHIRTTYPSSAGIFDLFRPFVEKGVSILRRGGAFGMVLPDIVLLKDYPETRLFLLENLKLTAMSWWGKAFPAAVIDAATIVGFKETASTDHCVQVAIHDPDSPLTHGIRQADFRSNPRYVFNLHLTPSRRSILQRLEALPRLGDWFEVHEGVHSGNMRAQLFVAKRVDASCQELLFGRDEIEPYLLRWNGAYLRRAAAPARRSKMKYANLGRTEWYEQDKLLVRRTGDYVLAAVDHYRRYASNNFFIVFPLQPCALTLEGLCALLNSRFMTWYFRTIEPRKGRVFAELKIKHLTVFPLPQEIHSCTAMRRLNQLSAQRAQTAARIATVEERTPRFLGAAGAGVEPAPDKFAAAHTPQETISLERPIAATDTRIDRLVHDLYGLTENEIRIVEGTI